MTLEEAMAQHGPAWLSIWLNILLFGAFVLPLALLIWRPTRLTAVYTLVASVVGAVSVNLMYSQMGYVKLLGLPHILFWTPLAFHLWYKIKSPEVTKIPRIIIGVILTIILISLAFDYVDAIRYVLGEQTPLEMPAS